MILDATASNRTIYDEKHSDHIVYFDIEKELQRKPSIIGDSRNMPFKSESFDTIIYDPPFDYGHPTWFHSYPNMDKLLSAHPNSNYLEHFKIPQYYGCDKYKNKTELLSYLYKTQKELYRILKPDGLLWLKWTDMRLPLTRLLTLHENWVLMITLNIADPLRWMNTKNTMKSYWCMLMKIPTSFCSSLEIFCVSETSFDSLVGGLNGQSGNGVSKQLKEDYAR